MLMEVHLSMHRPLPDVLIWLTSVGDWTVILQTYRRRQAEAPGETFSSLGAAASLSR
jgi:hypothetical protein